MVHEQLNDPDQTVCRGYGPSSFQQLGTGFQDLLGGLEIPGTGAAFALFPMDPEAVVVDIPYL
jgi:hypothetical protein